MNEGKRCELCDSDGGEVIARTPRLRIVRVDDAAFPGFFRVIWHAHVAEFSDLSEPDRHHCMAVVALVERALRRHLRPDKVNVASLGNMVPHLHWHIIARFTQDTHFPQPIWGVQQRPLQTAWVRDLRARLPAVATDIAGALGADAA